MFMKYWTLQASSAGNMNSKGQGYDDDKNLSLDFEF